MQYYTHLIAFDVETSGEHGTGENSCRSFSLTVVDCQEQCVTNRVRIEAPTKDDDDTAHTLQSMIAEADAFLRNQDLSFPDVVFVTHTPLALDTYVKWEAATREVALSAHHWCYYLDLRVEVLKSSIPHSSLLDIAKDIGVGNAVIAGAAKVHSNSAALCLYPVGKEWTEEGSESSSTSSTQSTTPVSDLIAEVVLKLLGRDHRFKSPSVVTDTNLGVMHSRWAEGGAEPDLYSLAYAEKRVVMLTGIPTTWTDVTVETAVAFLKPIFLPLSHVVIEDSDEFSCKRVYFVLLDEQSWFEALTYYDSSFPHEETGEDAPDLDLLPSTMQAAVAAGYADTPSEEVVFSAEEPVWEGPYTHLSHNGNGNGNGNGSKEKPQNVVYHAEGCASPYGIYPGMEGYDAVYEEWNRRQQEEESGAAGDGAAGSAGVDGGAAAQVQTAPPQRRRASSPQQRGTPPPTTTGGGGGGGARYPRYQYIPYHAPKGVPLAPKIVSEHFSPFVVLLRGLPFSSSELDVAVFLEGVNIRPQGVHLVFTHDNRPCGECFVQLRSQDDKDLALSKHRRRIGHRYVEVTETCAQELAIVMQGASRLGPPFGDVDEMKEQFRLAESFVFHNKYQLNAGARGDYAKGAPPGGKGGGKGAKGKGKKDMMHYRPPPYAYDWGCPPHMHPAEWEEFMYAPHYFPAHPPPHFYRHHPHGAKGGKGPKSGNKRGK